jgi:hypothetical protein
MSEDEQNIPESIRIWVWSGFYNEADAEEHLQSLYEDDPNLSADIAAMRKVIIAEFEKKAVAEKSWPAETDCDRLNRVFDAFDAAGICALQNAGYTLSDGISDIAEKLHELGHAKFSGYCFYHSQDTERAVNGDGLTLAYGDLEDDPVKMKTIGDEICAALAKAGFKTEWTGDPEVRINIPKVDWKRRLRK